MTGIPFIPLGSNAPKKVALPLIKAKMNPEGDDDNNDANDEEASFTG